jgi:hypothetical protein
MYDDKFRDWQIGDHINIAGSDVPLKITDIVRFYHPGGRRLQRIVVDGPGGFEGTQMDFESAGWHRVDSPKAEGE